ncbi:MAG: methyltransferase domain-containing protein [Bdellovibrionales bacterium]|nr:methyltransferase domain-containing protein [Bdellovibrionales bacterium]
MSRGHLTFLKAFLRRPQTVGSIVPSSGALAREMISQINFLTSQRIVEVGPGTGAITRYLIEHLGSTSHYMGIDINPHFIANLQQQFPRGTFVQGSGAQLWELLSQRAMLPASDIVSSIPWTILSHGLRDQILCEVTRSLAPDGTFTTFSYIHAPLAPRGIEFMQQLHEYFGEVQRSKTIWWNFPPAHVIHCRKPKAKRP